MERFRVRTKREAVNLALRLVAGEALDVEAARELRGAVCDAVRMEVVAGARDDAHLHSLRGLLARATVLPTVPVDYEVAAALHRACRRRGAPVRKLIDCLIGAVAVRHETRILHADADFDTLARHTDVAVHSPPR